MRKRVVVFGIFDGIHEGHRDFFRQAKEHGDELVVIVGRDSASLKWKGKQPKYSEQERLQFVKKEVGDAMLGDEEQSSYKILEDLNPDVICLGYDQNDLAQDLRLWLKKMGREIPIHILKPYDSHINHTSFLP